MRAFKILQVFSQALDPWANKKTKKEKKEKKRKEILFLLVRRAS